MTIATLSSSGIMYPFFVYVLPSREKKTSFYLVVVFRISHYSKHASGRVSVLDSFIEVGRVCAL